MRTERLFPNRSGFCEEPEYQGLRAVVPSRFSIHQERKLRGFIEKRLDSSIPLTIQRAGELKPDRFWRTICVGSEACCAVLGHKISPLNSRRGFHWCANIDGADTCVLWVPSTLEALSNGFIGKQMMEDLVWAISADGAVGDVAPPDYSAPYFVVETIDDSHQAIDQLRRSAWTAYDCETCGEMFGEYFEVVMIAAAANAGHCYVWGKSALNNVEIRQSVVEWLEDPTARKVGHNLKFDMLAPRAAWGAEVQGFYSDTQIKRKLLQADALSGLETCSELVGMGGYKQHFGESLKLAKDCIRRERARSTRQTKYSFAEHPALDLIVKRRDLKPETVAYGLVPEKDLEIYCARDAFATMLLERRLDAELRKDEGLSHIWDDVVCGAVPALEKVEAWGIQVDEEEMVKFAQYVDEKHTNCAAVLREQGLNNPNSNAEVGAFLFETLGLPPQKKSEKTGAPSTDVHTLKALQDEHQAVKDLLEYRRLGKLASAYGEKLRLHIRNDKRVHPQLKLDGTRTGRLSCSNPGLHQIPRAESDEGKMIKNCFVAPEGKNLIQLDYSQLELRVAAMLSEDQAMIDMFKSGEDFHTGTAKLISHFWGITPEQVEKKHRSAAKTFNFGLLYGMTDAGMATRLQCTKEEAAELRRAILGAFSGLSTWIHKMTKQVEQHGYTYTWWDGKKARKRPLYGIASTDRLKIHKAKNAAINTPVQGTASDFCLASIVRVVEGIQSGAIPAKLVLSVHDSIVLEAYIGDTLTVAQSVKNIMQGWNSNGVPLKVDCEAGLRWGSLEPLDV